MDRIILAAAALAAVFAGSAFAADTSADQLLKAPSSVEHASALDTSDYTPIVRLYSNNGGAASYVRFSNTSGQSTNFDVKIVGGESGTDYTPGQTYRITVPDKASPQRSIDEIRGAVLAQGGPDIAPHAGDSFVTLYVHNDKAGNGVGFQHVSYNGLTGFFENLSVCSFSASQDYSGLNSRLVNLHTTQLGGYPSKIEINNPDAVSRSVRGRVYDAATGASLGSFTATPAAGGTTTVDEFAIEQQLGFTPTSAQLQINIEFESGDSLPYTALVGHKVQQSSTGATFNLTQVCAINPKVTATCSSTGTGASTNPSGATSTVVSTSCTAAPVANADTLTQAFTVGQQSTISLSTLTANDTNASGATVDSVTAFVDSGTSNANGTYSSSATSITYTPAHAGTTTFSYRLRNSAGQVSGYAVVTLTVGGGGTPVANSDTLPEAFTIGQQGSIKLSTLIANDTNASDAIIDSITQPVDSTGAANGSATTSGTSISFTAARAGTATLTYRLRNAAGLLSNYATVTLTVSGGAVPVANADVLTQLFTVGQPGTILLTTLTGNDTNASTATVDGITPFVDSGTSTANGTYGSTSGGILYTPARAGTVTFTYRLRSSSGQLSAYATVTLIVGGSTNVAPVANSDTLPEAFTIGQQGSIKLSTLIANDINASDATIDSITQPVDSTGAANGSATTSGTSISFMAARAGTATLTYRLRNAAGLLSNYATVTLTVSGGAVPVANADVLTQLFTVGQPGTILLTTLTGNDTNASTATVDGITPFVDSGTSTANGTYGSTSGGILYTPARAGTVTFTYRLRSSSGQLSAYATVTLIVGGS